ncbi:Na+/H+ antiporter 1 [Micromonospora mirobrigensis]|uniref:Na+/H+ antiporter 1 n=1 Tax=Micromonospora mirobrigensis TaxID=262898 RepID=A0A1C4WFN9_9ACTN|nr:Na+/H+ antiporter 1 [Micromonospora mirobrigensis]
MPVFAFFAAGVSLREADLGAVLTDPIVLGIAAGLVLGKAIGIFGSTYLLARFTRAELDEDISWTELVGVALLAGIGFTVSLLIGELAFGVGSAADERVKLAVLAGSVTAAVLASIVLVRRNRVYRRIAELEARDADGDGVPASTRSGPAGRPEPPSGRSGGASTAPPDLRSPAVLPGALLALLLGVAERVGQRFGEVVAGDGHGLGPVLLVRASAGRRLGGGGTTGEAVLVGLVMLAHAVILPLSPGSRSTVQP